MIKTFTTNADQTTSVELFDASADFSGPVSVILQNRGPAPMKFGVLSSELFMTLGVGERLEFSSPDENFKVYVRAEQVVSPNGNQCKAEAIVIG